MVALTCSESKSCPTSTTFHWKFLFLIHFFFVSFRFMWQHATDCFGSNANVCRSKYTLNEIIYGNFTKNKLVRKLTSASTFEPFCWTSWRMWKDKQKRNIRNFNLSLTSNDCCWLLWPENYIRKLQSFYAVYFVSCLSHLMCDSFWEYLTNKFIEHKLNDAIWSHSATVYFRTDKNNRLWINNGNALTIVRKTVNSSARYTHYMYMYWPKW